MLTGLVENLLNRNLVSSPRARELCAALRGRSLRIVLQGTPWRLDVSSDGRSLHLQSNDASGSPAIAPQPAAADATIEGTPVSLVALAGPDPEQHIQRGAVTIRGDVEIAQQFRELALRLRPDLEDELARLLGDNAARSASALVTAALGAGRRLATTAVRNSAEYLSHETGDLVPRGEAEAWFADVDRLREAVDRLEARIALLEPRPVPPPDADALPESLS